MPDSTPEIDALCLKLYKDYPDAWRAIRRRLPSQRDESHEQIAEAVRTRLEAEHKGSWLVVVRRDMYACVFRPGWRALGVSKRRAIIGLNSSTDIETIPKVHFRLVIDAVDADAEDRYEYAIRLKITGGLSTAFGKATVRALRSVPNLAAKIPSKKEAFTVRLKSTNGLPGPGDEAGAVPDLVVEWFSKYMSRVIPALDRVLPFE